MVEVRWCQSVCEVRTRRGINSLIVTKAGMTGQGFYNDPALCLSPLPSLSPV